MLAVGRIAGYYSATEWAVRVRKCMQLLSTAAHRPLGYCRLDALSSRDKHHSSLPFVPLSARVVGSLQVEEERQKNMNVLPFFWAKG